MTYYKETLVTGKGLTRKSDQDNKQDSTKGLHHLGKPIEVYRADNVSWVVWVIISLAGTLLSGGCFAIGVINTAQDYTNFDLITSLYYNIDWFVLTFIFLCLFTLLALNLTAGSRSFAAIHSNGIRIRSGFSPVKYLRWQDLSGIAYMAVQEHFLHLPIRMIHIATIYPKSGTPIYVHRAIQEIPSFTRNVKTYLYPSISPFLKDDFSTGAQLNFGPITISQQGIWIIDAILDLSIFSSRINLELFKQKYFFDWKAIKQIAIDRGRLVIDIKGEEAFRLPVAKIPNIEILLNVVQQGEQG